MPIEYKMEFDKDSHTYKVDGKLVENVTRVLDPLIDLSMIPGKSLEIARQKGIAIHKMVELWCKDDLDESNLPGWMAPALEQWKKFVDVTKFKIINSEQRVYHPRFKYAGTLDLFGNLGGSKTIVDIKRSFLSGSVIGYQLAAYEEAHKTFSQERYKRYALRLREDGHFKLQEYTDRLDFTHFLTCLNWHRLKESHNAN